MKNNRLYIYLAQRDKKGIKSIANFPFHRKCFPTKIDIKEIEKLNLSNQIKNQIYFELQQNKLIYEIYLESAESFVDLKESLRQRGFSNLPLHQFNLRLDQTPSINEKFLVTKKSTMIRRKSDQTRVT